MPSPTSANKPKNAVIIQEENKPNGIQVATKVEVPAPFLVFERDRTLASI